MTEEKIQISEAIRRINEAAAKQDVRIQKLQETLESLQTNVDSKDIAWIEAASEMQAIRQTVTEIKQYIQGNTRTKVSTPPPKPASNTANPDPSSPHRHSLPLHDSSTIQMAHSTGPTIVLPPASSIPTFSGKPTERPRQFLLRVEEYARTINNWSTDILLKGISQFLKDSTLEWYCQLHITDNIPSDWNEFTKRFLAQFHSPIRAAQQEYEWKECTQQENETINEFVVRLRSLWLEKKPDEKETDFIKHLYCKMRPDMLALMNGTRSSSLDQIIIEAQQVEEILYLRNKESRSRNTSRSKSSLNESRVKPLMSLHAQNYTLPRTAQSAPTCWRCYETGHYANTCPLNEAKRNWEHTDNNQQPLPPRSKNI